MKNSLENKFEKLKIDIKTKGFWLIQLLNILAILKCFSLLLLRVYCMFIGLQFIRITDFPGIPKHSMNALITFFILLIYIGFLLNITVYFCIGMTYLFFMDSRFYQKAKNYLKSCINLSLFLFFLEFFEVLNASTYANIDRVSDLSYSFAINILVFLVARLIIEYFWKGIGKGMKSNTNFSIGYPRDLILQNESLVIIHPLSSFLYIDSVEIKFSGIKNDDIVTGNSYTYRVFVRYSFLKRTFRKEESNYELL